MNQKNTRRLEQLEARSGVNDKELTVMIQFVGVGENGKCYISGGIRIIPGQPNEELPASFFNGEDINEEA